MRAVIVIPSCNLSVKSHAVNGMNIIVEQNVLGQTLLNKTRNDI